MQRFFVACRLVAKDRLTRFCCEKCGVMPAIALCNMKNSHASATMMPCKAKPSTIWWESASLVPPYFCLYGPKVESGSDFLLISYVKRDFVATC